MKKGKTRKLIALVLAAVMVLAMCIPAMAADSYTITVKNAKDGESYIAFKIFDASYASESDDAVSYTAEKGIYDLINGKSGAEGLTFHQIGSTDEYLVTVDKTKFSAEKFAELLDSIKAQLPIAGTATAANGSAAITVRSKGYYFVDTTLGSLCSLGTAKNVEIEEKNTIPSQEKTVSDTAEGTYGSSANAQIGDTVYYQIKVTDSKGTDQPITIHDTMSGGLSLNTNSFTVTTKDGTTVPASNYSVTASGLDDGCTFELVLHGDYVKTLAENDVVVIKYSATLNENAVAGTDETNKSHLTYSNQTTTDSTPTVKTYKFQVNKYDGADTEKSPLAGAVFKLQDKDGNLVKLIKVSDTEYRVANTEESNSVEEFTTVASGNITITGVDADESYSIVEKEAPAGYNKLHAAVSITVNADNSLVQPVENNKGSELPSTGGMGTKIFYLVGIICVAGAGVVLVSRRRMNR